MSWTLSIMNRFEMVKVNDATAREDGANSASRISIGQIIEKELRSQERSVAWFCRKIHCDRRNVYDIFRRESIDTSLLLRISEVLGVDFFKYYSLILLRQSQQSSSESAS